ncbi:homoserine dehydrogenase [Ardenticatena maritima]|uniref:Homoserine dehydrogenase n=1 Tax=Ardenticatena maritima TaxID=872965 RepID=A0A0M8K9A0_9CHLR|nr:homoserine dehydrogenase [Ardenticatena maritima]KPL89218.1 hypothetical protein SE16_01575 [Ardenticatena maritima]GAP62906.1 homoserine dehydrogenase [Ardenticatena maritima]
MQTIDVVLHGVGHVGRHLLRLFQTQADLLRERHNLTVRVIAAVDSRGAALNLNGLDIAALLDAKQRSGSVAEAPHGQRGMTLQGVMANVRTHAVLLEATPVNLETGEPGLSAMRTALERGWDVVSANKAPLVLAYRDLVQIAHQRHARLAFSATVCGGLPVINVGRYDLAHATITRIEGIVNSTTNYILSEMRKGRSFDEALREAQHAGIAEADPTLDVSGWDAANKLIIMANAILHIHATRHDVDVEGIEHLTREQLLDAETNGQTIRLVASAERQANGTYRLRVAPRALPKTHPLAILEGHQMGVVFETDINGRIFLAIEEEDPTPTAAAMLRDIVLLANPRG